MENKPMDSRARTKQILVTLLGIVILLVIAYFVLHATDQGVPGSLIINPVSTNLPIIAPLATQSDTGVLATPDQSDTPTSSKCFIGGCSGQICSDLQGAPSTCEYQQQFACYKTAKCEVQKTTGKCGWTKTAELNTCLKNNTK